MTGAQRATGFLVAAIILLALADYVPHLVNGVLVLILAGVVLKNSAQWQGQLNTFSAAISGNKTTTSGG